MLVGSETTVKSAVLQATADSLEISTDDIVFSEIDYGDFEPNKISKPEKEEANAFNFYRITVYSQDKKIEGFGIRNTQSTYGQPVTVEIDV